MDTIDKFRQINPNYKIYDIHDSSFSDYGVVYPFDNVSEIDDVISQYAKPKDGMKYVSPLKELESKRLINKIKYDIFGDMPIDVGLTFGHSEEFTAFEYHQCSEVNIMLDDVIMVLGKRQTLETYGTIDPNREAKMFYVPKGSIIELYNDTLHYAPLQVTSEGYKVVVIVISGTNTSLSENVVTANPRLVKKGKFQVVHACRKDKLAQGYKLAVVGDVIKTNSLKM